MKKSSIDITNWTNADNAEFYEKVSAHTQYAYSVRGGLNDYTDMELIAPYIAKANSILEIGACYGRVLQYFIKRNITKEIVAIERSRQYYNLLLKQFNQKFKIVHTDIFNFDTTLKFDIILWLWSGISDFAKYEQANAIKKLSSLIKKGGYLIIDTFSHSLKPANAKLFQNNYYLVEENNCKLFGYIPSPAEIIEYSNNAELQYMKHKDYKTSTNRPRTIFTISKR